MKKFDSVWEFFTQAHHIRPKTVPEIVLMVDKSRRTVYHEIKNLVKHDMLEKIELTEDSKGICMTVYRRSKEE